MPSEGTYFDLDTELLNRLLHLHEHGIRIVAVTTPDPVFRPTHLRLFISGPDLPEGHVVPIVERVSDGRTILKTIEPAGG